MKIEIKEKDIPKKINEGAFIEAIAAAYPDAIVDLSRRKGITVTSINAKGKELKPVFHPPVIVISNLPKDVKKKDVSVLVKSLEAEKSDADLRREKRSAKFLKQIEDNKDAIIALLQG